MSKHVVRIAPKVKIDILYQSPDEKYYSEVDCRLLFLGEHYRKIVCAYQEIARLFSQSTDPNQLFDSLKSASGIQQFYEIHQQNGSVSVELQESIFRQPEPSDELELALAISAGKRTLKQPLRPKQLQALGTLLSLLRGDYSETKLKLVVEHNLSGDDKAWATEVLAVLRTNGFLEHGAPRPNRFLQSGSRPRVTFMGHSSILLQSRRSAVLVDPVLRNSLDLPSHAIDVTRMKLGAICCSHSHWDHCDLQTLLWFDKDIPILVPKVRRPSAFNPPIVCVMESLGFTDIREVELWEPIHIEDIELIPVPFYGEQDEPDAEIDHYTYVLRTEELTLYGGVDCFRDTFGEMTPVLEKIRQRYQPQVAFLPISKMIYRYGDGGVNGFCRYLDVTLLNQTFQYTAASEDAAEWMTVLDSKWVVPYATFTFSRWATPLEVTHFQRSLRRVGLSGRLYLLRPLDFLDASDLDGALPSKIRSGVLLGWFRLGASVKSLSHRLRLHTFYRLLRRVMSKLTSVRNISNHTQSCV